MISVFSEHITPRLTYVLDFVFAQKGFEYSIISSTAEWNKIRTKRINYSHLAIACEYHIKPHDILFEDAIRENIRLSTKENELLIDGMHDEFALIFRFLSRYEEYLPHERDEHDRFKSAQSEAIILNVHNEPVCDQLVKKIWKKLELDYSLIEKRFECVPSFDLDVAWAYKNRNLGRTIGAGITRGKVRERLRVLTGREKDPYDTYSYISEIASKVNRIICFAPMGDWAKYDKNIHWKNYSYQSLLRGLNTTGGMGIHPSYESHLKPEKLETEITRLEQIVGHEITKSRQHFLRLRIPETYELLIDQSIRRDFTMGWADTTGFRAGTSFPFYFFNLRTNAVTPLLVFPFAYMDGVLKDQLKLKPEEAMTHVARLTERVKEVGGVLMFIWHNSSINDLGEWKGWKAVLDYNMTLVERTDFSNLEEDYI